MAVRDSEVEPETGASPVRTLARGLTLLELIAGEPDGVSITELASGSGLDKGTAWRLVAALRDRGYVRQRTGDRRYVLTGKLLNLSQGFIGRLDLRSAARPHLERLRERSRETVHLAVLDGATVVYIDHLEPDRAVRVRSAVGNVLPLHVTAMGRAILAAFPESSHAQVLAESRLDASHDHLVYDLDRLAEAVEFAVARGWATVSRQDEVSRVGAAITEAGGRPVGAVSVSGPAYRMNGDLSWAGDLVREAAAAISAELGAA
ncbi:IclR family transcriptional regulator [Phytohabitans sp. ZYX-F-186]|uniref:IclR family transcriptional regulator n=1 Tax=Phytohabitans maris TaxID=3071409 RepID=A0ABU0ZST0_9ACTN|nr:IclR family transcriptional regulator [Phytohabitans sp. ZYX-F-186]MDQ7910091.1 IclR family transcriptional regulator [Phytohabitans sp. ZYX-F-186]